MSIDTIQSRLRDEADQCRNDGANDIAALLDDAATALDSTSSKLVVQVWQKGEAMPDGCGGTNQAPDHMTAEYSVQGGQYLVLLGPIPSQDTEL